MGSLKLTRERWGEAFVGDGGGDMIDYGRDRGGGGLDDMG